MTMNTVPGRHNRKHISHDVQKLVRSANAARDRKDWQVAASHYRAALELDPSRNGLRVQLGHMLKEAGDLAAAAEAYFTVLKAELDDADLHLQIGHLRKLQGDLGAAMQHYLRALELAPGNVDARQECAALEREGVHDAQAVEAVAPRSESTLQSSGTLHTGHRSGEASGRGWFKVLFRRPGASDPRRTRRKLVRAANAARDRGRCQTAAELYRQALALDPSRHGLRVQLGHMLKEAGDLDAADEAYQTVLESTPDDDDLHVQIGHLRKLQGDPANALWHYRRALELAPDNVHARSECEAMAGLSFTETSPGASHHGPREARRDIRLEGTNPNGAGSPRLPGIGSLAVLEDSLFIRPIVSFDLFDTLIRRRYLAANEVHDTVSAYVLSLLGRFGTEDPGKITLARYTATNHLKTSPHIDNEEPSLAEIWTQLIGARIGHGARAVEMAHLAAAFEYDIECENLAAVDGAVALLARLKAAGKRVIAISDMYFSAAQIDAVLDRLGLLTFFDHVFVSCEVKATKQTGNLFRHACGSLAVTPHEIVHLGDNLISDVAIPQGLGIEAIHIDQPRMLRMERPDYGRRDDIHAEITDLIKLFSIQTLFYAKSDRADHVYFMSRDGCLINRLLDHWRSPLIGRYLDDVPRSNFFLSRATSCWLGTNFQGKWLLQSVGHAFWLHLGQATARQISAMFGIEEVPAALGDMIYRSDRDTDLVVQAYEAAGLAPAIKASLLAKRAQVEQYLMDTGFFAHRSVVMCDVGYSGTVVRDLNTYFLQESTRPEPDEESRMQPPRIDFHVIASNGNYAANAIVAAPHVTFNDRVVLPVDQVPQSLVDSFAWLEMFFKHPTFGPLLGYGEVDGRMVPRYDTLPDPGTEHPSARVLAHAPARGADIALLWMAAIHFWGQFTQPLLERFAHPDDATVAQMLDDVYETDAVTGKTRSVVLVAEGLSDEEVYKAAKAQDYWIPGSLVANAQLRAMASEQAGIAAVTQPGAVSTTAGRLWPLLRSLRSLDALVSGAVDVRFYRDFYDDLRVLPDDDALRTHYLLHGRKEGRYRSAEHMRAALSAVYGRLPKDFDHTGYLWANPDLVPHDPPQWHAELHYLKTGRAEGRGYRPKLEMLDREFEQLTADGTLTLTPRERAAWEKGTPARILVFRRHGIGPGPWLDALDLAEFNALNFAWCGRLPAKAAAVAAFLSEGIGRLAPLSLAARFEPDFYRAQYYGTNGLSDTDAYRHWLRDGSLLGHSPCEAHRLQRLIGVTEFPTCFAWDVFRRRHARRLPLHASRTDALEGFLTFGTPSEPGVVAGEGTAALWAVFGQRAASHGRPALARAAFRKALDAGGAGGRLWHKLGDLAFEQGDFQKSIDAYTNGVRSADPDRWSYIKGVLAACQTGAVETGFNFLTAGMAIWKEMEPWRRARTELFQVWYARRIARIYADQPASGSTARSIEAADHAFAAFIAEFIEKARVGLPSVPALSQHDGRVVVITGHMLLDRTKAIIQMRSGGCGRSLTVFSRPDIQFFAESLVGASVAILHEVICDADIVHAILLARSYGVQTQFWIGEPGVLSHADLDLSDLAWSEFMIQTVNPHRGRTLPSFYAAALCDLAVTTMPSMLPALEAIRQAAGKIGGVIFVPDGRAPLPTDAAQGRQAGIRILLHLPAPAPILPHSPPDRAREVLLTAALLNVLRDRPHVTLLIDGELPPDHAFVPFAGRIHTVEPRTDAIPAIPLERIVDIVVDLTTSRTDHRSRWADAALASVAAILGPDRASPYLTDGADAIITRTTADLLPALLMLIDVPKTRRDIGARAHALLSMRFSGAADIQAPPAERRVGGTSRRRRILYANVFFAPQTIGGATRVLKDNVDHLLDTAADRYEAAVFASDDENNNRGATRCDSYRGIPVFRIATPQEIDMDWRTHNAEVGSYARRVLDLYQPDLVHIHCLQRLSVAFVEACRIGGYPYIVTLHDAWWLSDFPFLLDEDGRPALPDKDILGQAFSWRIGLSASVTRADRLRRALHGAQERLAVSEPFAELYRKAGFAVRTIANGLSSLDAPPRQMVTGAARRVRLGHIGGTQHHKGAYLVEAVLRNHSFDHLSLTIIELARDPGDDTQTVWGNTPVSIIGKVPSDRIAELYGRLDVLLAPSTWPESFGLVSREAASMGLWVVASDQGAMGEMVIPDQNGFIIDVGTPAGLLEALRRIDADPARFSSPPAHRGPLRKAADQGREIIAIYDRMTGDGIIGAA